MSVAEVYLEWVYSCHVIVQVIVSSCLHDERIVARMTRSMRLDFFMVRRSVSGVEFFPACPVLHKVFVVALQEVWGVKIVWAFGAALSTFSALLYLLHFVVEFVGEVNIIWSTTEEEIHSVAALYFDASRAGLAVAAASAKVATESQAVFLDTVTHLVGENGRVMMERYEFIEFAFALDSPNGLDVGELGEVCIGGGGMVYESAGQSFHGNKSNVVNSTLFD